jgi:hypothetical protein
VLAISAVASLQQEGGNTTVGVSHDYTLREEINLEFICISQCQN